MRTQRSHTLLLYLIAALVLASFLFVFLTRPKLPQGSKTGAESGAEHEEYTVPTKYENIQVKTVEERSDDGRYLLHASWPVSEHDGINADLDNFASDFISEFKNTSADIKQAREEYIQETGTDGATFHASYNLHFDVSFANENYVAFTFTIYRNTGNTGTEEIITVLYNRQTGERIPLSRLFANENYLETLSELSREDIYQRMAESVEPEQFSSEEQYTEWLNSLKANIINPGTEPTEENFHSLVIDAEGFLDIHFDRYQVAPGAWGVVTVQIPLSKVKHLFTDEVRELFELSPEPETPVEPPPTSQLPNPESANCATQKCIALTFDDGPSVYTDSLLATLQSRGAKATFFVLGITARVQQQTLLNLARANMEIGNHTWDHKDLTKLSLEEVRSQIDRTGDLVETITGTRPVLVRPPYGATNDATAIAVNQPVILWNIDPEDWKYHDSEHVAKHVIANARRNAIILAHDIHETTVAAIPEIIDTLTQEGYVFVTVSELLGSENLVAGRVYR